MNTHEEYDYFFKILLIGDTGCGKTSILLKFTEGKFLESHIMTIGIEGKSKFLIVRNKKVKLQIMDTAGQERFRALTKNFFKNADGILFVYDITDMKTFNNLKDWISQANNYDNYQKLIVGNKKDLENERQVTLKDLSIFAKKLNCAYIETSALTNENIPEAFSLLVKELMDAKMNEKKKDESDTTSQRLSRIRDKQKIKCEQCKYYK